MHHKTQLAARAGAVAALLAALTVPAGGAAAATSRPQDRVVVHPGQSIQEALDSVAEHGTVVVEPATYAENLAVTRPVTLEGHGLVRLVPPATLVDNVCTRDPDAADAGTNESGICIVGTVVENDPPTVVDRVEGVTIRNLTVDGFDGIGVEAYATRGLRLDRIVSEHNAGGGFFAAESPGARLTRVTARDNAAQAVNLHWADDGASVSDSTIEGNTGEGVFLADSAEVTIARNSIRGNCVGIAAVALGLPGGGGLRHLVISGNEVVANNRYCPRDDEGAPSESGTGIGLFGAVDSVVTHNRVMSNAPAADAPEEADISLGGIAVGDGFTPDAVATRNRIADNVARSNSPFDLADLSTGDNTWRHNSCATSLTSEGDVLCHR